MKKLIVLTALMLMGVAAFAKNKQTFKIEVVDAQPWERDFTIEHPATAGTSETRCDTSGNASTTGIGNSTYGNGSASTNCTTTTKPGEPAYTEYGADTGVSIHAILNGRHIVLLCQRAFRPCAEPSPGVYEAEAVNDHAVKLYEESVVTHKVRKIKYRLAGTW